MTVARVIGLLTDAKNLGQEGTTLGTPENGKWDSPSWKSAREIERQAWERIRPFIEEVSGGRFILVNQGPHARRLQEHVGDLIMNLPRKPGEEGATLDGRVITVEIKVELRQGPNLFLEMWSNRNLADAISHAERGSTLGWLFRLRSEVLLYAFDDTGNVCVINVLALKQWAFKTAENGRPWPVLRFDEKPQRKRDQKNDAWGCCVPIAVLQRELGQKNFKVVSFEELGMFETWEAAE